MARQATTTDVFNAVAEPRRRQIIDLLARSGSMAVGAMVLALNLPQPVVSKHLNVLRQVGVVSVVQEGKQRVYSLDAAQLKPIHDWVAMYEKLWQHKLDRIKQRAEQRAKERSHSHKPSSNQSK